MTKDVTIYQVDAFTSRPFKGNPAGVCILDRKPSAGWMQNIAMEMNLSETAFVFPGKGNHKIRYYTPTSEINLCGHATLSSAHIMFTTGITGKNEEIIFSSKAGILRVRFNKGWVVMNFPAYGVEQIADQTGFERITGLKPVELYRTAHGWTLALVKDEDYVRNLNPDLKAMKNSEYGDLIVTAPSSDPRFDFCVRCFAPAVGIDEDPVTGSAHCALVPFWNGRTGKREFISHQVSKREGILKVALKGNRVEIGGQAKTILKATLLI